MNRLNAFAAAALVLVSVSLEAATFTKNAPATTNNDDSCDISVMPAATLLVPYFEVDINAANRQTTMLTITNTSYQPQSVRLTLWTDYGFPVLDFPIYLTGYDVQNLNLFDIIVRGRLAPDDGTGFDVSPVGELSGNDNPLLDEATCNDLPVQLPSVYINRMKSAFTLGSTPALGSTPECTAIGGTHANAIGYATIDVVGACTASLPTDPPYFSTEIRYDNVLIGDYLQVDGESDAAQGSPMVHIRAIPEGDAAATRKATNLRRTFYGRYQTSGAKSDARQPLPSTFAARWIAGGPTAFETYYKIWREVRTSSSTACSAYGVAPRTPVAEVVRFDEEENPETYATGINIPEPIPFELSMPATALISASGVLLPPTGDADVSGWIYFNLHDQTGEDVATQNWIVTSMRAEGRFSVDADALGLGNGCTPVTAVSNANRTGGQPIGPAANTTP